MNRLKHINDIEDEGINTACNAMAEIREKALYRVSHETFESYVTERFGPTYLQMFVAWEEFNDPNSEKPLELRRLHLLESRIAMLLEQQEKEKRQKKAMRRLTKRERGLN